MSNSESPEIVLDSYVKQLIRVHAARLIKRPGFTASDREDIEQELALHVLQQFPKYDFARSQRNTFLSRIVAHKAANLRRNHCREYLARRGEVSLSDLPDEYL